MQNQDHTAATAFSLPSQAYCLQDLQGTYFFSVQVACIKLNTTRKITAQILEVNLRILWRYRKLKTPGVNIWALWIMKRNVSFHSICLRPWTALLLHRGQLSTCPLISLGTAATTASQGLPGDRFQGVISTHWEGATSCRVGVWGEQKVVLIGTVKAGYMLCIIKNAWFHDYQNWMEFESDQSNEHPWAPRFMDEKWWPFRLHREQTSPQKKLQ